MVKAGLTGESKGFPMEIIVAMDSRVPEIVEVWKEIMDFHKDIDPYWTRSENGHTNWEKHLRDIVKL